LVFWAWCLISASVSALPGYSLGQAGVWIRFLLFAFASAFWLARDLRILTAIMGIFLLKPAIGDRFVTNLYSQLPTHETSP